MLVLKCLLRNVANGNDYIEDFGVVKSSCYSEDFDQDALHEELILLQDILVQIFPIEDVTSVRIVCDAIKTRTVYKALFFEVNKLLIYYFKIPIT